MNDHKQNRLYNFFLALFYISIASLIYVFWRLHEYNIISPKHGVGYWIGITGVSFLIPILTYSLRKRFTSFQWLGSSNTWMEVHVICGTLFPFFILVHSNFNVRALNSAVAFYSMLVVMLAGMIGKYLHFKVNKGYVEKKEALKQIVRGESKKSTEIQNILNSYPEISRLLNDYSDRIIKQKRSDIKGLISIFIESKFIRKNLNSLIKKIKKEDANADIKHIKKETYHYISTCKLVIKAFLFERVSGTWQRIHMPLFFVMLISIVIHVISVHWY